MPYQFSSNTVGSGLIFYLEEKPPHAESPALQPPVRTAGQKCRASLVIAALNPKNILGDAI